MATAYLLCDRWVTIWNSGPKPKVIYEKVSTKCCNIVDYFIPLHRVEGIRCQIVGCSNGGIGRHEGLKILWPVMAVRVQVPLAVLKESA